MCNNESYINDYSTGYLSDIGNARKINEDYIGFYENESTKVYIVADGMGGHNAGDVASKIAVKSCINYMKKINNNTEDMEKVLKEAINYANNSIYEKSKESNGLKGMGTTITACLVYGEDAVIANVGDSSCYIITKGQIKKATKDHSLVQELIDDGSITEEEALKHPNKNIITRALGTKNTVDVDTFKINLKFTEKVILCTDGLSNYISKEEMFNIILNNNNQQACKLLVELCKNKGGRDNISVIIFGGEQK